MLSQKVWNALLKNAKDENWNSYIGKTFFYKEWNTNVTIKYYTLCGQLFFYDDKNNTGYIWADDYKRLYA